MAVLILLAGVFLFIPGLGQVHLFDWDEINFAESAREMLLTNDFMRVQINYEPFWEKPPLFFWLQCLFMKVYGINEFAARLPNALTGVATLLSLFFIGKKLFGKTFGGWWALAYAGTVLPHFYFKTGIIDPLFNLLIFWGVYLLYRAFEAQGKKYKYALLSGICTGLAVLTKGPVALLVPGLSAVIFIFLQRRFRASSLYILCVWVFVSLAVAALWFGAETLHNGPWFLETFIKYQMRLFNTEDSGHGQPVYYHPLVLLIGCFPASIFALKALVRSKDENGEKQPFVLWAQILFWVVLIIFSVVKTKIVHYSSLCYFPITFLAVYALNRMEISTATRRWWRAGLAVTGWLLGGIMAFLPIFILMKDAFTPHIKDTFAVACINAPVQWTGFEATAGLLLILATTWSIFSKQKTSVSAPVLFGAVIVSLQLFLYMAVPKIEQHVQGTLVTFLQSKQGEDYYVKCVGFKSYAQYFYSGRQPGYNQSGYAEDENRLIYGEIDKPVYIVTKSDRDSYRLVPQLKVVLDANGWVVYKRTANNPPME